MKIRTIVNESADYLPIYNPLIKALESFGVFDVENLKNDVIRQTIKNAKNKLSGFKNKQKWITYALKHHRVFLIEEYLKEIKDSYPVDPDVQRVIQQLESVRQKEPHIAEHPFDARWGYRASGKINFLLGFLSHYSAYDDFPPMRNYDPSNKRHEEVSSDLRKIEAEYFEQIGDDERLLRLEEGDKIIKDFGDGVVWVMLSRGACQAEGDAMGHCGNAPSVERGDRIISLRKVRDRASETFYEPFLTFIYNEQTKLLGERKGRANTKPSKKYHPYIMWLLKQPWIEGLSDAGYEPENNFMIGDLSYEKQNEVFKSNPNLMLVNGMPLERIPKEVLDKSDIKSEAPKGIKSLGNTWFSDDKTLIYTHVFIGDLIEDWEYKSDASFMDTIDQMVIDSDITDKENANIILSKLNDENMKKLYEDWFVPVLKEAEEELIDFEEFSREVKFNSFYDIFEEYVDEEGEPIDFSSLETYQTMENELLEPLQRDVITSSLQSQYIIEIMRNMPTIEIEPNTVFTFSGEFITTDDQVVTLFGDDVRYVRYQTNQYFDSLLDPDWYDNYLEQGELEKIDVDIGAMGVNFESDEINSLFEWMA